MTATHVLASGGTNLTAIGIILGIFIPVCAAMALIVGWYFRLQRHRAKQKEATMRQPPSQVLPVSGPWSLRSAVINGETSPISVGGQRHRPVLAGPV